MRDHDRFGATDQCREHDKLPTEMSVIGIWPARLGGVCAECCRPSLLPTKR
jgi:hypothetical protein